MGAAVTEAFIALPLRTHAGFHFFLDPAEEYRRVSSASPRGGTADATSAANS